MNKAILALILLSISVQVSAMSSTNTAEFPADGMSTYQIRVFGTATVNIQGIVSYYDKDGTPQIARFYGVTPMVYEIDSKEGLMAVIKINPAAPSMGWMSGAGIQMGGNGIIRAALFKGNSFISEKNSFADLGEITFSTGKYPYENLGFMLLP